MNIIMTPGRSAAIGSAWQGLAAAEAALANISPLHRRGASDLVAAGAARSGRRIVHPHAHTAAPPPFQRGTSRREAALTSEIPKRLSRWLPLHEACLAFADGGFARILARMPADAETIAAAFSPAASEKWFKARRECQAWLRRELKAGSLEMKISNSTGWPPDLLIDAALADRISLERTGWHISRDEHRLQGVHIRSAGWMSWHRATRAFFPVDWAIAACRLTGPIIPGGLTRTRDKYEGRLFTMLAEGQLRAKGTPMLRLPALRQVLPSGRLTEAAMSVGPLMADVLVSSRLAPVLLKSEWWTVDRFDQRTRTLRADDRIFGDFVICEASEPPAVGVIGDLAKSSPVKPKRSYGKAPEPGWQMIEPFIDELLAGDGIPISGDGGFAKLVRATHAQIHRRFKDWAPDDSTVKRHVRARIQFLQRQKNAPGS